MAHNRARARVQTRNAQVFTYVERRACLHGFSREEEVVACALWPALETTGARFAAQMRAIMQRGRGRGLQLVLSGRRGATWLPAPCYSILAILILAT